MTLLSLLLLTTLRIRAGVAAATFASSTPWLPPRAVGFLSPPTARRQQQLGSVDWTTRQRSSSSSSSQWNVLSSEEVVVPPFFPSLQRGDRSRGGVSSLLIASSTASASSAETADTAQQQQPTDGRRGSRGGSNRRRQQKRRRNNNGRRNNGGQRRNNNSNNYYTDARSLERRITTLGRTGKTSQALDLYNALWSSSSSSTTSTNIVPTVRLMNGAIDACARARPTRLETAFELFEDGVERGLEPNVFTFGSLMSVCARGRDAERALKLLKSMQDEYNISPNAVVYSTAISACERSVPPRSQMALKLLRESTQDSNVQMSVVGYNAAISALARAGEWELAVQLLDEMESGTGTNGGAGECSSSEGNSTNGDSTNGEMEAPAVANGEAVQTKLITLLNPNVIPPQPDGVTYGTVMAACERSEKWHEVLRFANAMLNHENLGKGIVMDGMALTSALHACQRLGLADEAMEYLTMMKRLGGINGAAANGQTDDNRNGNGLNGADRSLNQRQTQGRNRPFAKKPLRGPDSVAYRLAISACARSPNGERWHDGIRLLTEMRNVTGSAPDVVAYTAAISGCAAAGEWRYAFQLLDEMRNEGVEPNVITYSVVIDACATASSLAAGRRSKDDDTSEDESDKPSSDVKVTGAIRKPMQKALKLLNVLNNDPTLVEPNVITYNAAIRACAEGLDLKKAFRLMEELKERNLRPTLVTYGSLMTACERVGNVDGASKVFRMMKEQQKEEEEDKDDVDVEVDEEMIQPNEIIYGAAISCCRKAGEPERALLLLKKMIKDNLSPNTATFNTVLMAQTEDKQSISKGLDRAMLVYKLMKSTKYAPNKSQRPNRQTYTILIRSLSQNKRPADAELLLRKMSLEDQLIPDVDLYTSTVTSYERCGQPLRAVQLMESMNRDGYDFYEVKVLNAAFKKAVRLVNAVVSSSPKSSGGGSSSTLGGEPVLEDEDDEVEGGVDVVASLDDGEEDMFVNGR